MRLLLPPPVPGQVDPGSGPTPSCGSCAGRRGEQMDLHTERGSSPRRPGQGMREIDDPHRRRSRPGSPWPAATTRWLSSGERPADVVWDSLTTARKRAVIRLLADIRFGPVAPAGPVFDPATVRITWKA